MKKRIKQQITVEIDICNICGKEITYRPSNDKRYEIRLENVRGLGKTSNFDAHPTCINRIIRNAFKNFLAAPKDI